MSNLPTAAILPVSPAQAAEFFATFVNRRAYVRQSHFPSKKSGRFYYYKAVQRNSKELLALDVDTVRAHLAGHLTIGIYSIAPEMQTSKWVAIDADYEDAIADLRKLQDAFREDQIQALMEQSRRGGHLWFFLARPLKAKLCRTYVLNIARRLGIAIKRGETDGIEVFPRQNEITSDEYGNAIRGPLGIHRASMQRYWFEDAAPNLAAQIELLNRVRRVTKEQIAGLTADMQPVPDDVKERPTINIPVFLNGESTNRFQILEHVKVRRKSGKNYLARCPSCARSGGDRHERHLSISVAEPHLYHCWAGCTRGMIREALGYPIRTSFPQRFAA